MPYQLNESTGVHVILTISPLKTVDGASGCFCYSSKCRSTSRVANGTMIAIARIMISNIIRIMTQ